MYADGSGGLLPTVIPAPEPESRGGGVDSRVGGSDDEGRCLRRVRLLSSFAGVSSYSMRGRSDDEDTAGPDLTEGAPD